MRVAQTIGRGLHRLFGKWTDANHLRHTKFVALRNELDRLAGYTMGWSAALTRQQ
jgi:hypothetical protein